MQAAVGSRLLLAIAAAAAAASTSENVPSPLPSPILSRWHSIPVAPNRSILATFLRLRPGAVLAPRLCPNSSSTQGCIVPEVGDTSATSVSMVVPADWAMGEYAFQLCGTCAFVVVNRADPLFAILEVSWAPRSPSLRIVGRALAFDAAGECIRANSSVVDRRRSSTRVRLRPAGSSAGNDDGLHAQLTELIARSATCFDLEFDLPVTMAPGSYHVEVHNGLQSNWSVMERTVTYRSPLTPMSIQHAPHDFATLQSALAVGGSVDLAPNALIHLGANDSLSVGLAGRTVLNCSACVLGGPKPVLQWVRGSQSTPMSFHSQRTHKTSPPYAPGLCSPWKCSSNDRAVSGAECDRSADDCTVGHAAQLQRHRELDPAAGGVRQSDASHQHR